MALIDQYAKAVATKKELFNKCIRIAGPLAIGPTNRGGNYLKYKDKDIDSDISVQGLRDIRNIIDLYLNEVIGE
jgi:hypothetical protein